VPDARLGEEIMAWITLRPGATEPTADDLGRFATGHLARYEHPRYVRIVDTFPTTVTGKVRKTEMRRISIELLGRDAAAATRYA
jgi:fatty-acyl-CoA synthase